MSGTGKGVILEGGGSTELSTSRAAITRGRRANGGSVRTGGGRFLDLRATGSEGADTGWLLSMNKSSECSIGSSTGAVSGRAAAGLLVYRCVAIAVTTSSEESLTSTTCLNEILHTGQLNAGTVHCLTFAKDSTQYWWKVCAQGAAHSSETGQPSSGCRHMTHICASMYAK